jgi:hypothetical protein
VPAAACAIQNSPGVDDSAQPSAPASEHRALITHAPRVLQDLVTRQPILSCRVTSPNSNAASDPHHHHHDTQLGPHVGQQQAATAAAGAGPLVPQQPVVLAYLTKAVPLLLRLEDPPRA